ncbi:glycosyltransferase family 4 protein [Paucihalobacter sp.]|uniref:glycosyltransferase family 4 protein n=2 Tax=Paucihalobacter sp. TaxID=2850405 RepID=UPI002FE00FFF
MLQLGAQLEAEGYRVHYTSSQPRQVLRMLDMLWTVIKCRRQTDVVLLDTYGTLNFYYAVLVGVLCRVLRLPYIPILHGGTLPERLEKSPRKSALVFKHAKLLVSPSLYLMEAFKQYGYHNLRFIPNTIAIDNYPMVPKRYESIRLLWVRSFSKIYNPCMAVYLLKQLQNQGHKATLTMVGPDSDGSLKTVKALAAKLKVKINFTGKLCKPEWIALAKEHNIFINTTNFDNMPVSVIEAMALGLPVVSTKVGGMPYLIEDGVDGVLVPLNDVSAMAEAILRLQSNADLANAIAVRARVKAEGFDWSVVRKQWLEFLSF